MGAIASMLGEGAEKLAQKLTGKMEQSSVGRGALNLAGNQEWELELTPGGKAIKAMHEDYIRLHDKALQNENEKLLQVRNWHENSSAARSAVPVKDGKMIQYHAQAVAEGHPIQRITKQIVDAGDGNLTQKELMIQNQQKARLTGIAGTYGDHFQNATPILASMLKDSDPRVVANAHRVADIISNQVRDTRKIPGFNGSNTDQSYAKVSMNKAFKTANKVMDQAEIPGKRIPYLDTEKTYEKQPEAERTAHRVLDVAMLPFLAVKHVGQFFNPPSSSPLLAVGKSLLQMDHAEMEKTVEASSITASTMWSAMYRDILGESGKVAEWTNSPTVGKIIARSIHEPGFTFLRRAQLNMAGSVGFHSAIYWAHNFAQSGSKIAEARLREIGIDPADVLKQNGKLDEAQLAKGVYHYTNNRMFFHRSIDNSLWQNRNIFARAAFMYHSFVNSQASFMRREMLLMLKAGDIKGLAQFAGTLGVLFPAMAPLLSGAEKLLQTGSVQQGGAETKERYERLVNPKGATDWIGNYTALLSHLGAAGVYFNYINAIKAHRLASAVTGPIVGAVATDVSDSFNAAFSPSASGEHNFKPLERDVLRQAVPIVGGALAHHFAPTLTEQASTGRSRSRLRLRGRRR